jgi:hypothetical protein
MNLKRLAPNPKTCKKLRDLGFPQDTALSIMECFKFPNDTGIPDSDDLMPDYIVHLKKGFDELAAPTFQEIEDQSIPCSIIFLENGDRDNLAQAAAERWISIQEKFQEVFIPGMEVRGITDGLENEEK